MTTPTPHPIQLKASETYLISIESIEPMTQEMIHTEVTEAIKDLKADLKADFESFSYRELADNIDMSDLADRISALAVAREMCERNIADEINLTDLGAEIDLSALQAHLDLKNMINYRHLAVALINHLSEVQAKP